MSKSQKPGIYAVRTSEGRPLRFKKLTKKGNWKNVETGLRSSVQSYQVVAFVE